MVRFFLLVCAIVTSCGLDSSAALLSEDKLAFEDKLAGHLSTYFPQSTSPNLLSPALRNLALLN
ncbi:MAG TPA: hypothetical protein V6D18_10040 [Thermosynechococcaceae cyanobacterium]